ncbi:hypothetical protein [Mangrovicoccus ximenensis]|uniref:hypothetical protein n=1 Tax=Mangrovicoccus ximenensis TaxID=1911570 RepID=UPI001374F480|nr:hypothetical protein [Mangrovicoccus ximenensis]
MGEDPRAMGDAAGFRIGLRSFVAAVALAEAFEAVGVARSAISLKWPNDVLLYDCKAAGILLESAGQAGRLSHLANLAAAPDPGLIEQGGTLPISLAEVLGRPLGREDMLLALARAYAGRVKPQASEGCDDAVP